jgi:hypothetical protein
MYQLMFYIVLVIIQHGVLVGTSGPSSSTPRNPHLGRFRCGTPLAERPRAASVPLDAGHVAGDDLSLAAIRAMVPWLVRDSLWNSNGDEQNAQNEQTNHPSLYQCWY